MRLQQYINEEYSFGFKHVGKYIEVFSNPSQKEIKEIGKSLRFFADNKSRKIYAFNGYNLIHGQAWEYFPEKVKKGRGFIDTSLLPIAKESKYVFIDTLYVGDEENRHVKGVLDQDWKWVDKYVKVSPILNRLRKEMERNETTTIY